VRRGVREPEASGATDGDERDARRDGARARGGPRRCGLASRERRVCSVEDRVAAVHGRKDGGREARSRSSAQRGCENGEGRASGQSGAESVRRARETRSAAREEKVIARL